MGRRDNGNIAKQNNSIENNKYNAYSIIAAQMLLDAPAVRLVRRPHEGDVLRCLMLHEPAHWQLAQSGPNSGFCNVVG